MWTPPCFIFSSRPSIFRIGLVNLCYASNFAAVDIYAGVAASLADRKRGGQLTEFFRNIKGTIDDDDWDQVKFFNVCCVQFPEHICNIFDDDHLLGGVTWDLFLVLNKQLV